MKTLLLFLSMGYGSLSFAQVKETAPQKPFVLGVVSEIQSTVLSEKRILNIYLPEGYNPNDSIKYPVVYLLDGSADEDFIHITGLYQFNSFEWINQVPKSIIVGIGTVDRRRDFTFPTTIKEDAAKYPTTGHSDKFITFLQTELQPYIEKKYNVNESKTIIGQSLGGLIATEILFGHPDLFTQYIIVSPSLWWDNESLLNMGSTNFKSLSTPVKIYIGVGKEGLQMETDANLLAKKIRDINNNKLEVYFDYLPQEDHATIMHQAVFNALRLLNPVTIEKK